MENEGRKVIKDFFEEHFETVSADEFHEESPLLAKVGYKLFIAPYVIIACSVLIAIICHNLTGFIIAAVFIALSIFVMTKVRDFPTMDIHEKALVIYTNDDAKRVVRIPYEDIKEWEIQNDPISRVRLITKDDLEIIKNTFQLDKAAHHLYRLMPEKETGRILREQVRTRKMKVSDFLERVFNSNRSRM